MAPGRGRARRRPWWRVVAIAVACSAAGIAIALLLHPDRAFGAVPVALLGVVTAAALGGAVSGVLASALSFLGLNYFFTQPRHTFRVASDEDVVALVVFFVVSLIVGSLLSRALDARARAVRSEREARLLGYLATKVMSGAPLDAVLSDFTGAMTESLRLSRCEIRAQVAGRSIDVATTRSVEGGAVTVVPLRVAGEEVGTLTAERRRDAGTPSEDDDRLLRASAGQVELAVERVILDARIAEARTEAEVNRARAALFSSVTHDLRTPLSSIKAGVTTLLQDDVDLGTPQRRELLTTVLEETDRLNRLLGNLLELARVRAGALVPAKESTAVDEVVESVLHRMGTPAFGVTIRTILRETPDAMVDPVQLDQVLTNLLDNAVRFSPHGGEVLVSVAPWKQSIQIRVADQGPGIPAAERERVFEAFYRGDAGGRSGSGLGLAIARAIVLAHGGRIRIEGAPSGGAAVVIELPIREASPVPQETGP